MQDLLCCTILSAVIPIKIILPSGLIIKIFIKGDCFLKKTIRTTESAM